MRPVLDVRLVREYIKPAPFAGPAAPPINVGDPVTVVTIPRPRLDRQGAQIAGRQIHHSEWRHHHQARQPRGRRSAGAELRALLKTAESELA